MKHLICGIAALVMPIPALAAGPPPAAQDEKSLDFALQFAKAEQKFAYTDGTSADTTTQWIGITWYERLAPRFELGIYGGHTFLTQTGNPATAGLEPDGYYAGIGARGVLLDISALQLFAHATYTYQRVEHNGSDRSVTLAWDEPRVQLGAVLAPIGQLRVYGGAMWGTIDGRERVTGLTARTTDFKRHDRTGGFLGLDLAVDRDGYVGVEARSGIERGGDIYFKKRY